MWTDLFLVVERFVEGDRAARIRLDQAPWSGSKVAKRLVKHGIWLLIAVATGGAWVFYFADAPSLAARLVAFDAPAVAYITIGVLTFTTYTLGGLAREQVCIYMCPWPRIQGAMLDEDSLVVTYREYRGEPRGPYRKGETWQGRGDCVDCNQCVVVCPMGIDIRDGQQLECITCALCIDACNEVMDRVGRPRGLVAYDTLSNLARRAAGAAPRTHLLRPRIIAYAAMITAAALAMLVALSLRPSLDVNVLHDRNPLFVTLSDGSIRNGYTLKVINKLHEARDYRLSVEGLDEIAVAVLGRAAGAEPRFTVKADRLASFRVFLTAPRAVLAGAAASVRFVVTDVEDGAQAAYDSVFRGPER